jgi:hypothetical protein
MKIAVSGLDKSIFCPYLDFGEKSHSWIVCSPTHHGLDFFFYKIAILRAHYGIPAADMKNAMGLATGSCVN